MRTNLLSGALLAATLWSSPAPSQTIPTSARLATAKLAESKGDLAAAEQGLREALAEATGSDREAVAAALRDLLARQGRSVDAPAGARVQEPAADDPIQRLIATIDRGSWTDPSIANAIGQLQSLGGLVVPHLLAALPQLGPFGLNNTLSLLGDHDDARIAPALERLLDTAGPEVWTAIAGRLHQLQDAVARPLASYFAAKATDPQVLAGALKVLIRRDPGAPSTRHLALRLVGDAKGNVAAEVLAAMRDVRVPWADEVLRAVRDHGPAELRAEATLRWVQNDATLAEATVLPFVEAIADARVWLCSEIVRTHTDWVHVGLLGLRAVRKDTQALTDLVSRVEWWRLPEQSGPALLDLPLERTESFQAVATELGNLVGRGWQVAPPHDAALAEVEAKQNRWHVFVAALPADAEPRATAVWETLSPAARAGLVHAVAQAGRPWHGLVVRHLASLDDFASVSPVYLDRDWTGASPDAVRTLESLAARWAQMGRFEQPRTNVTSVGPNAANDTRALDALVAGYRRNRALPSTVLTPLASAGFQGAWFALMERDPRAAVQTVAAAEQLRVYEASSLLSSLPAIGTEADVPLALRAVAVMPAVPVSTAQPMAAFLARHAPGNVATIRLASMPTVVVPAPWHLELAEGAARHARIEDLAELLQLLPSLERQCADQLARTLAAQVRPEHGGLLLAALTTCAARTQQTSSALQAPIDRHDLLMRLLDLVARCGDAKALPSVEALMASPSEETDVVQQAATTALAIAGPGRAALVRRMLGDTNPTVVTAALGAEDLRTDAALRDLARAAVLRIGDRIENAGRAFAALDEADQVNLALAVVGDERFPRFKDELCQRALQCLGGSKDASHLSQLVRGAAHPSYRVRLVAATSLGNTFSREAAPQLLDLLKDDAEPVRQEAQKALDQIASYLDARAKWEARLR